MTNEVRSYTLALLMMKDTRQSLGHETRIGDTELVAETVGCFPSPEAALDHMFTQTQNIQDSWSLSGGQDGAGIDVLPQGKKLLDQYEEECGRKMGLRSSMIGDFIILRCDSDKKRDGCFRIDKQGFSLVTKSKAA